MKGQVLDRLSEASARKWQAMENMAQAQGWGPTLKLCLIILVAQTPLDIAVVLLCR